MDDDDLPPKLSRPSNLFYNPTNHDPPPLLRQPLGALGDGDQVLLQVDELLLLIDHRIWMKAVGSGLPHIHTHRHTSTNLRGRVADPLREVQGRLAAVWGDGGRTSQGQTRARLIPTKHCEGAPTYPGGS